MTSETTFCIFVVSYSMKYGSVYPQKITDITNWFIALK